MLPAASGGDPGRKKVNKNRAISWQKKAVSGQVLVELVSCNPEEADPLSGPLPTRTLAHKDHWPVPALPQGTQWTTGTVVLP